ncbi:MAG: aldo/keto reductase [Chloroflexota bacterium]|nr:aldo/keto reductase [Chloroflexota bacterium]
MEYRRLGQTGLEVSTIGLGTNNFGGRIDFEATKKVLHQTMEEGINFLDCANTYGAGKSEEFIGQVLGKEHRQEMIIATKVGNGPMGGPPPGPNQKGATRHHIMTQVDLSLKRLDTDYIDLYYMHRWDPDTPIEETMRALDDLVHSGKVRYLGCSNYTAWQMVEAIWTAKAQNLYNYCCVQPEYSLVVRDVERELVPATKRYGMSLIPFFPLASGFLTGKYSKGEEPPEGTRFAGSPNMGNRYFNDDNWSLLSKLQSFAGERGHSVAELAFSWLLGNPVVPSVIAGATKPEQVTANAQAAGWQLSDDEMAEIREML